MPIVLAGAGVDDAQTVREPVETTQSPRRSCACSAQSRRAQGRPARAHPSAAGLSKHVLLRPGRAGTILGAHAAVRTQPGGGAGSRSRPVSGRCLHPSGRALARWCSRCRSTSAAAVIVPTRHGHSEISRNAFNVVFSDTLPSSARTRTCGWGEVVADLTASSSIQTGSASRVDRPQREQRRTLISCPHKSFPRDAHQRVLRRLRMIRLDGEVQASPASFPQMNARSPTRKLPHGEASD